MADQPNTAPAGDGSEQAAGATQQPAFAIERIYVKDLSLENPGAPQSFQLSEPPSVELGLRTRTEQFGEHLSPGVYRPTQSGTMLTIQVAGPIGMAPRGSGLKLHAAGYLLISDGSLLNRGSYGYYWSSTQYDASYGWRLYFSSGLSTMSSSGKAYGFSARCVRD